MYYHIYNIIYGSTNVKKILKIIIKPYFLVEIFHYLPYNECIKRKEGNIMAMMKCRECKKEISDKARICPICGARNVKGKQRRQTRMLIYVLIILVVLTIVLVLTK